uniref:Basic helix-loop-helix transcription factor n=1 Tax=Salvia miltiorrhiza TaxID=226208 RepID=A0A0H3Y7N0_SALMI|nr:basic helix-loop-helix transcription factor [Salvia miltiorrhiza]
MEEQDRNEYLQFSPLVMDWIASNASGSLSNFDSDQHYIKAAGSGPCQWMHCQPTPQNYVQFLSETGHTEIQKQLSYDVSAQFPTLGLPNPSQLEEYLRLHNGGDFVTSVTGLEQLGVEEQKLNEEFNHAFETYSQSCAAAYKDPSKLNRKRSRERAYATDRIRKLRISRWLDALQELVPSPERGGQAALLDGVIDYIKYLQYQMKDLCRNRLGGGSTSNSVIFLEEHGHYFVQDQMLNGPLEEMIGKLISAYPSAATELLQSRGLIVLPMTFAEELLESTDMLDMQG